MRSAMIERKTKETQIKIELEIDGKGSYKIDTGCGFLDHMLELFTAHGSFDIKLECKGDANVDFHHTTEDVAIVLGQAFDKALGDRSGINRYGDIILPMDEALILAAVDISGRASLGYALDIKAERVGSFDTELVKEFFTAFTRTLKAGIHIRQLAGENSHHIIEGAFKALARVVSKAVQMNEKNIGKIPSTKGTI